MISTTTGYLGEGAKIPPDLILRVMFNSPFGMFKRVGPPTVNELIERQIHFRKMSSALNLR